MQIKNGNVFFNNALAKKDIVVEDGLIKKIASIETSEEEKQDNIIDAKNMLILPGLIDVHVHFREPGDTYKEDFKTGSRAAIAGGITTAIDMPNNKLPTITVQRLKEKQELAKKAICDVLFHFGATENNFGDVAKANPLSLKMYLSETTGDLLLKDETAIIKHFRNFDRKIVVHAEGQKLIDRVASLVKSSKLHLAHATTKKEIETVKTAASGASVEVTPHHLFLSKKHEEKLGKLAPVKPPLRDEADRKSIWQSLRSIDCIAADHAPHTIEDKESGAYGYPGLETSLSLMLDAFNKKLLPFEAIVQKMAINPARIFGLIDRGEISIGKKADLILVDTKKEWTVNGEELETKCKWSPFDGWRLKGKVIKVIRNGKLIYDDGEFIK